MLGVPEDEAGSAHKGQPLRRGDWQAHLSIPTAQCSSRHVQPVNVGGRLSIRPSE